MVCDGALQCHDGSDEFNCPGPSTPAPLPTVVMCTPGSKLCDNGRECVNYDHLCDGDSDCMDGSDEQGCPETCRKGSQWLSVASSSEHLDVICYKVHGFLVVHGPDEFQCAHGKKCLPSAQVCDGRPHCRDHSDELDCWERTKSCEHRCADNKRCIPAKFLCDGERDCVDGTDEVDCGKSSQLRCCLYLLEVGDLISSFHRLPGPVSVPTTSAPVIASTLACITPSVRCPGSTLCVSQAQLCDGQRDCPDGFDESNCVLQCKNRGKSSNRRSWKNLNET